MRPRARSLLRRGEAGGCVPRQVSGGISRRRSTLAAHHPGGALGALAAELARALHALEGEVAEVDLAALSWGLRPGFAPIVTDPHQARSRIVFR